MKLSSFPLATMKEEPADASVASHRLMLRSGMIRKVGLGLYSWQPLGFIVLKKVEEIVRNEMNRIGCCEIAMPLVQPLDFWRESARADNYGPELLVFEDRNKHDFCLGPTHEEVVTKLAQQTLHSVDDFPTTLYQIQNKFRDEIRPRFGVMRAREFLMKDAYSFHMDKECLQKTYNQMYESYKNICEQLKLKYAVVTASSGEMGGNYSHEFHVLADTGEDYLAMQSTGTEAYNIEVIEGLRVDDPSTHVDSSGSKLQLTKGIEIGHIFQLQDTYTKKLNYSIKTSNQNEIYPQMGCYGIGISRICAAAIEQNHDDKGIIWNQALTPFHLAIAMVNPSKFSIVVEKAQQLYQQYLSENYSPLLDDRGLRYGQMMSDLELIGLPVVIIVGERNITKGLVEIKPRIGDSQLIAIDETLAVVETILKE